MSLIECKNLKIGYDADVVLENLSFSVNAGDYLCIVGENGSGKSTLMKTLLSLIKPLGGEINFGDGLTKTEIGYLPQQTEYQKDFPASVKEIVLSGFQGKMGLRPFYNAAEKKAAAENMEKMGVTEFANRSYSKLSGGQQQRVLLARALCATSKLILLDEPVAGLDPKVTTEMYALIESLNKEGITVIMISHDVMAAMRFSDHILHIGHKIFFGTTEEFENSKIGRNYLEGEEM